MFDLAFFMERTGMPPEVARELLSLRATIDTNGDGEKLEAMSRRYYYTDMSHVWDGLNAIAQRVNSPVYMVQFLMYVDSARCLFKDYQVRGLSEEIFWDTVCAAREELMECVSCKKLVGGYSVGWIGGFFEMTRFQLGRFQYELFPFRMSKFERGGHALYRGQQAVNIHIPSSGGSMKKAIRLESYRRAYEFFRGNFPGGEVPGAAIPFMCDSWLLFSEHEQFLQCCPNIVEFMHDFEIVHNLTEDSFSNGWRIFFDRDGQELDALPRDTSLQRAYIDWMSAGNKTGSALGVFFFDGEKIL